MASVRDLHQIRPGLYLGGQRAEQSPLDMLKEYNISHIVQVGTGYSMRATHKDILEYCCIGVLDADHEPLLWHIKQSKALHFIDTAREKGAVLVHCQMGMSRSATVVIAYLMWKEKLTFEAALADVIKKRAVVAPNPGFCAQLMAFGGRFNADIEAYDADVESVTLDRGSQLRRDMAWLEMLEKARSSGSPPVVKHTPVVIKTPAEALADLV